MNDETPGAGILALIICSLFGVMIGHFVIQQHKSGKNEGIVFCVENPKECKVNYDYLKLK
jgi:hypothetical protein